MKITFISVFVLFTLLVGHVYGDSPDPMPIFMPSTPAVEKKILDYTVADVLGIVSTNPQLLPVEHPYVIDKKYMERLKAEWPGAKIATNIDQFLQLVLDAAVVTDPQNLVATDLEGAWGNIENIIFKVMSVTNPEKVEAILRTINAQTNPSKKLRAKIFGWLMFNKLLDHRLLILRLDELDDATVYSELYSASEESPKLRNSIRKDARDYILDAIENILKIEINKTSFVVSDEAVGCAALKLWVNTNLNQISEKCTEIKSSPDWEPQIPFVRNWDPRW